MRFNKKKNIKAKKRSVVTFHLASIFINSITNHVITVTTQVTDIQPAYWHTSPQAIHQQLNTITHHI